MFSRSYGLVYRKGKWHIKNYGRVLKNGAGLWGLQAHMRAWWANRTGETPIIDLKRIVPRPGPKEDYELQELGPALEPGDLLAFKEASPFIKVSWKETEPGK